MKTFNYFGNSKPKKVNDQEASVLLFKEVCTCEDIDIIDNDHFMIVKMSEPFNHNKTSYKDRKKLLREFAKEWQRSQTGITSSYEDLSWWGSFFEKYGKKYGLLTEFRANGICKLHHKELEGRTIK